MNTENYSTATKKMLHLVKPILDEYVIVIILNGELVKPILLLDEYVIDQILNWEYALQTYVAELFAGIEIIRIPINLFLMSLDCFFQN